jgi:hydroxymethylpyrimidine pyrophosphatase-like HAD family hydrolase
MRYLALATDGDGTLLEHGRMADNVASALARFREAGGRVFLVTGERIEDLANFPGIELIDQIVAENGALILNPILAVECILSDADPAPVLRALNEIRAREVKAGRVLVSTKEDERRVRELLARQNLNWHVHHNRGDLLLLPAGIDKATGLAVALKKFNLKSEQVVGIGDAENDRALIEYCGLGAAVANAVPVVKEHAAVVTRGHAGRGVIELIDAILRDDFSQLQRGAASQ